MALEAQSLDTIPLIRRKRAGELNQPDPESALPAPAETVASPPPPPAPLPVAPPQIAPSAQPAAAEPEPALRMKPREMVQLAAVHVRIPEQLARGLRLMSVLEDRQAQILVAEMLEEFLSRWNPRWRDSVPPREF